MVKTRIYKNRTKKHKSRRNRNNGGAKKPHLEFSKCSPVVENNTVGNTCLTGDMLNNIKEAFNNSNPEHKITAKKPKNILQMLKKNTDCNDENCWLNPLPDKNNILSMIFRPKLPEEWKTNKNEWLSNHDILDVIKQYELSHTEFIFIGPTFVDFASPDENYSSHCIEQDLCKFDLQTYINNGKTKIGIIFNLDKHNQSGSHWVSLFIDVTEKFIFYFNSTGEKIPNEILELVNTISKQSKSIFGKSYRKIFNSVEHQKENTECGMYSLFFIISMVTNSIGGDKVYMFKNLKDKIHFFTRTRIPDDDMENLRIKYYITK